MAGCADWENHVIVCGLEGVGLRAVEQLQHTGVRVVVIDDQPDDRLLHLLGELGVPHIGTTPRLPSTLREAGIGRARAILCLQASDLDVLETVLLAREIAPDLRIVTRLTNRAVARALVTITGPEGMLDFADLVAPAIVETCLGRSTHEFSLAGEAFAVATSIASRAGTLRDLFGDLAPVAVVPGDVDNAEVVVCPGRDLPVTAGDAVTLIGTPGELAGLLDGAGRVKADGGRRLVVHRIWLLWRALLDAIGGSGRGIVIVLGLLATVSITSTLVLMAAYVQPDGHHLGFVNAAYFTAETVATVGFGDFSFAHQAVGIEIFGIALILVGATLVTALFAFLTNLLVSRRIAQALGHYRVPGMTGHLVVVGLGSLGLRVVELLRKEGYEVVVIDRDESNRHLERARSLGVSVVPGDATEPEVLASVNFARARGVAVLTSDDLTNIETGIAARAALGSRWNEVPVAIRLFDHLLAETVTRNFSFRYIRSTSDLAAPWFVGAALGLSVSATFTVEQQTFFVGSLTVSHGGGLEGLAMADLSARTRVVALQRADGALEHPPRRQTTFRAGDVAYLIGPSEELITVLRRDEESPVSQPATLTEPDNR